MNELNADQLDLISGGDGLTVNGGGDWQPYEGQQPPGGGGERNPLMQNSGDDPDAPGRPATYWP